MRALKRKGGPGELIDKSSALLIGQRVIEHDGAYT